MSSPAAPASSASSHGPERLLVRGVNWLGDAVMTTPALQRLREALPDAHVTLLTPEKLAGLWARHPAIDAILTFAPGDSAWATARRLQNEKFDTALVLPNSIRSALETWLARIPRRIGYRGGWRTALLTQALAPRPGAVRMRKRGVREIQRLIQAAAPAPRPAIPQTAHQLHHYLHLAAALGASPELAPPRLYPADAELGAMRSRLGLVDLETQGTPLFGLNPGAEYGPAKRWPVERFIAAGIELRRRTGCRWVLFGGRGDQALCASIETALNESAATRAREDRAEPATPVINLAAATTLPELCAALSLCRLLLTNDTGPMHVAAAVGTPVVVPFGSTSPELTGPGLPGDPRHHFLRAPAACAPCFRRECPIDFRCLRGLGIEPVVGAVIAAWTRRR